MIGNDVVDLFDRDANMATYRGGFDARVFTTVEQARIAKASESARERWRLWAAKEASYKLARQIDPETIFSPRKFEVQSSVTAERATVIHGDARYFIAFAESSRHIHAVAVCDPSEFEFVIAGVESMNGQDQGQDESAAVRALACGAIAEHLAVPRASLEIRKNDRIPQLFVGNDPSGFDVSLSHHGEWVAFAGHALMSSHDAFSSCGALTCNQGEMRVA